MSLAGAENLELVRKLHRLWSTGDLSLIDEVYAEDFTAYWPPSSAMPIRRGSAGVRAGVARVRQAFPDWKEEIQDLFGSGDRVASRFIASGVQTGVFADIAPTGRRVEIHEISTFRIAQGRIVEQWCAYDELARLQQLGVDEAYLKRMLKL